MKILKIVTGLLILLQLSCDEATPNPDVPDEGNHIIIRKKNDLSAYLGLANLGNTCFANSVHQLLRHIPDISKITAKPLTQDASETYESFTKRKNIQTAISAFIKDVDNKLDDLFNNGFDGTKKSNYYAKSLQAIYDAMDNELYGERFGCQMDAAEYLDYLLGVIEYRRPPRDIYYFTQYELVPQAGDLGLIEVFTTNDTGQIHKYPITVIRLELAGSSLAACLDNELAYKTILPRYRPTRVSYLGAEREADKNRTRFIKENPRALGHIIFQLGRYNDARNKISSEVVPSSPLNIPMYDQTGLNRIADEEVEFIAVVVHHGSSLNSGHYTFYGFDRKLGGWVDYNDTDVKVLSTKEWQDAQPTIQKNGYLFLYVND